MNRRKPKRRPPYKIPMEKRRADNQAELAKVQEKTPRAPMTHRGHESLKGFKPPRAKYSTSCRHCYGAGFTIWQGARSPCVQCSER